MLKPKHLSLMIVVLSLLSASCFFGAEARIRFDARLGALIGCGPGRIRHTSVIDVKTQRTIFVTTGHETTGVDTVFVVPGTSPPPLGVSLAKLEARRKYEIETRQGDVNAVVYIWTDGNGRVDSSFVATPCAD